MIDLLSVFTTGGIVLWQKNFQKPVSDNVVNSLIREVFIENRAVSSGGDIFHKDNYNVKYKVSNDYGLIFVLVYQSIIHLTYGDELLSNFYNIFLSLFSDAIKGNIDNGRIIDTGLEFTKFESMVDLRVQELENANTSKSRTPLDEPVDSEEQKGRSNNDYVIPTSNEPVATGKSEASATTTATHRKVRRSGKNKGKNSPMAEESPSASGAEDGKKKPKKQMRRWADDGSAENYDGDGVLDYSTTGDGEQTAGVSGAEEMMGDIENWGKSNKQGEFLLNDLHDILENSSNEKRDHHNNNNESSTRAFGFLKNILGGKTLNQEDLEKALNAMRDHLLKKNVASEVADHLCSTVDKSLIGSKTQSWTSVESTVKTSMTEALKRILTPNTSLDLLHEVEASHKTGGRPYVISVVGVNGVGKSTNLSKLAFWLLQNKYKVLIAACDTFRSGAVEQLRVHVQRLQELTTRLGRGEVEIFDQGYGKDAAVIAQKAVDHAQRNRFDVVLMDTAGRRHNDERLMSSLEKFGKLAQPNKIIMVGEALVGTDSVQQAKNFNSAFGNSRNLDFFLISKCDTVGDMIGSMVNMTYSTGIPVLFVGIGQNYTDLRNLSVDWAVKLLMS